MEYIDSFNLFGNEVKQNPCIILNKEPTGDTVGLVGMLAMNINSENKDLYKCIRIPENNGEGYIWEQVSSAKVEFFNNYSDFESLETKNELTDYYVKEESSDDKYLHYRWNDTYGIISIGGSSQTQGIGNAVIVDSVDELKNLEDKNEFTDYYVKTFYDEANFKYTHYRWKLVSEEDENGIFIEVGLNSYTKSEVDDKIKSIEDEFSDLSDHPEYTLGSTTTEEENTIFLYKNGVVQSSVTIIGGGGTGGPTAGSNMSLRYHPDSLYNYSIRKNEPVEIKFFYKSEDASIPNTFYGATYKVKKDESSEILKQGNISASEDIENPEVLVSIDLTSIVQNENCKIKVEIEDEKGTSNTIFWNIKIVDISFELFFNDKAIYSSPQKIKGRLSGGDEKVINWKLEYFDEVNDTTFSTTGTIQLGSDYDFEIEVPKEISHGSCLLECTGITKINGKPFSVEPIYKDILFYDSTQEVPLIGCIYKNKTITVEEYSTINIPYYIIHPKTNRPKVTQKIDNTPVSEGIVEQRENIWSYQPSEGEYDLSIVCEDTQVDIKVIATKLSIDAEPVADRLEIDFNPVGLTNDFNKNWTYGDYSLTTSGNFDWMNGGYKNDETGSYFLVKAGTTATLNYTMFDKKYFLKNDFGTSEEELKEGEGQELKIIFKTENAKTPNAIWLTNVEEKDGQKTGLQLGVQKGWVKNSDASDVNTGSEEEGDLILSSNSYLYMTYSEEDIIELDINMEGQKTSDKPFLFYYEDGVPAKAYVYSDGSKYHQTDKQNIVIGSPDCDVRIYRLKIYSKSLETKDIMRNFIADSRDVSTKIERYNRNSIYYDKTTGKYSPYKSGNYKLDPDALAAAMPDVKILLLSTEKFTTGKRDFIKSSLRCIHAPGGTLYPSRGAEDNWFFENGYHAGQGTTSDSYGASGRNVDFLFNCDGIHKPSDRVAAEKNYKSKLTIGYGMYGGGNPQVSEVEDWMGDEAKVSLTANSIPNNFFNFKVNIASSENANNALLAKRYDEFLPYKPLSKIRDSRAKTDMEFVPAILFIEEKGDDISSHTEFEDSNLHFYALGNLGDSKKTDYTRAYDPDDMNEFTIEVSDNNKNNVTFQTGVYLVNGEETIETAETAGIYDYVYPIDPSQWNENNFRYHTLYNEGFDGDHSFEPRYACCGEYRDGKLINGNNDFSFIEDESKRTEEINFMTTCRNQLLKNEEVWRAFYRWVITSTDTQFKEEIQDWCVKEAVQYFYAFTHIFTMMDNRAKNTFWHFAKTGVFREIKRPVAELLHVYCEKNNGEYVKTADTSLVSGKQYYSEYAFDFWNYDNDTALGINNDGELNFPAGKEDIDKNNLTDAYIFNGAKSVFWLRVRELFGEVFNEEGEIIKDNILDNIKDKISECCSSEGLIKAFDDFQGCYPEEIWRLDIERKYIRPYLGTQIDNSIIKDDPHYLKRRMQGRKKYQRRQWMREQEYYFGTKYNFGKADVDKIYWRGDSPSEAEFNLYITPYSDMYINLEYGNGTFRMRRAFAGIATYMPEVLSNMIDTNLYVRGSNRISLLGDISLHYPKILSLGEGEKLKELILCSAGNKNESLTELPLGTHPILEKIDISGINGISGELNLTNYFNLSTLLADGAKITSVKFTPYGKIKTAFLPNTINTLELKNLSELRLYDESISTETGLKLAEGTRLTSLTMEGGLIDSKNLVEDHIETLETFSLKGINWEIDNTSLLNELLRIKENAAFATLTGKVTVTGAYNEEELQRYRDAWTDLTIEGASETTFYTITYKNTDSDKTTIYTTKVAQGTPIPDPVTLGFIEKPVRDYDEKYTYEYRGWSTDEEGEYIIPDPFYINEDIILYASYNKELQQYIVKWNSFDSEGNWGTILTVSGLPYGSSINFETALAEYNKEHLDQQVKFETSLYLFDILRADWVGKLFTGWNKSTGFITVDPTPKEDNFNIINVDAKWEEAYKNDLGEIIAEYTEETNKENGNPSKITGQLTATQVFTLEKAGYIANDSIFKPGDEINITLGKDFDFDGVDSNEIIKLKETRLFCGGDEPTQPEVSTIKPFEKNTSFVLAIDFEIFKSNGGVLMSCISNNDILFSLESASNGVRVRWNGQENTIVLKKDRRTLAFVYDKQKDLMQVVYPSEEYEKKAYWWKPNEADPSLIPTERDTSPLVFGGIYNNGMYGSEPYAAIYWCKIWYGTFSNEDLASLVQWNREELKMEYYGKQNFTIADSSSSELSSASFICQHLLSEASVPIGAENKDLTWDQTELFKFANQKLYEAFPTDWKNIIKKVNLKTFTGNYSTTTTNASCYIYAPSWYEISPTAGDPYFYEAGAGLSVGTSKNKVQHYSDALNRVKFSKKYLPESGLKDIRIFNSAVDPTYDPLNNVKDGDIWRNGTAIKIRVSKEKFNIYNPTLESNGDIKVEEQYGGGAWLRPRNYSTRTQYRGGTEYASFMRVIMGYGGSVSFTAPTTPQRFCPCFSI